MGNEMSMAMLKAFASADVVRVSFFTCQWIDTLLVGVSVAISKILGCSLLIQRVRFSKIDSRTFDSRCSSKIQYRTTFALKLGVKEQEGGKKINGKTRMDETRSRCYQ